MSTAVGQTICQTANKFFSADTSTKTKYVLAEPVESNCLNCNNC